MSPAGPDPDTVRAQMKNPSLTPEPDVEAPGQAPDGDGPAAAGTGSAVPREVAEGYSDGVQSPDATPADAEEAAPGADEGPTAGALGHDPLVELERERDEYLELAQRTQADFDNFRRRSARDAATSGARAKAGLVRELLPVVDNIERALAAATEAEGGLANGVRLVYADLLGVLERNGILAFEPVGEPFDPTVHEALTTRAQEGAQAGLVLDVVEKGYRLDQTVLRPARVVVSA